MTETATEKLRRIEEAVEVLEQNVSALDAFTIDSMTIIRAKVKVVQMNDVAKQG